MNQSQLYQKISCDRQVSDKQFRIYCYVENFKRNKPYSIEEVATAMKVSPSEVDEALKHLGELGYITVKT